MPGNQRCLPPPGSRHRMISELLQHRSSGSGGCVTPGPSAEANSLPGCAPARDGPCRARVQAPILQTSASALRLVRIRPLLTLTVPRPPPGDSAGERTERGQGNGSDLRRAVGPQLPPRHPNGIRHPVHGDGPAITDAIETATTPQAACTLPTAVG
jgi:hypothetical protein